MKKKGHIGSSFDDFLKEDGIHAEVTARAIERVTARRIGAEARERPHTEAAPVRRSPDRTRRGF